MKLIAQFRIVIVMLALTAITQGCMTDALWDCKHHEPEKIYLATTPQTNHILVFYTDYIKSLSLKAKPEQHQQLAYWLLQPTNTPKQLLPEFVDVTNTSDLVKVPVVYLRKSNSTNAPLWLHRFSSIAVTNSPPEHGYYVLAKSQFFGAPYQLWHDGQRIGNFNFPSGYQEWGKPTFLRVALTPLTAATDVVIVASIVTLFGASHYGGR